MQRLQHLKRTHLLAWPCGTSWGAISHGEEGTGCVCRLLLLSHLSLVKLCSRGRTPLHLHLLDALHSPWLMEKPDPMTPSTVLHPSRCGVSSGQRSIPAAEGVMELAWDPSPRCRKAGTAQEPRGQCGRRSPLSEWPSCLGGGVQARGADVGLCGLSSLCDSGTSMNPILCCHHLNLWLPNPRQQRK